MVLLSLSAVTSYSQANRSAKAALFTSFPNSINCSESQLASMFAASKGQQISLSLGNNLSLSGAITSKLTKYSNLQTIVVKLPAFKDALFSLSKQIDQNNHINYVGRIMNPQYADGFELKRTADGNYQFVKIDLEKILVDCSQF
jgi:hypothetical protein